MMLQPHERFPLILRQHSVLPTKQDAQQQPDGIGQDVRIKPLEDFALVFVMVFPGSRLAFLNSALVSVSDNIIPENKD